MNIEQARKHLSDCNMSESDCLEIAAAIQLEQIQRGDTLTSPGDVERFLSYALFKADRERFGVVFLDTRHRVIEFEILFEGSIDCAAVYPRIVAERALKWKAAACILAHNHPSGVAEPSLADQAITKRIKDALAVLEIRMLDHFVCCHGTQPISMAARGMI